MNQDQIAQQERFARVVTFAESDAFKADFPSGKPSGQNVQVLREVLVQLPVLDGEQKGSGTAGQAATDNKKARLDSVRADLVGMAKTARALHEEHPDLQTQFKLPDNERDSAILSSARAQLVLLTDPEKGADLVEIFVDYGMRPDLVADLQADIAAADAADSQQDAHSLDRRGDTLAIDTQIGRGIQAVVKLDAYCHNRYAANATAMGQWTSASHLELRRVFPKKPPTP